MTETVQKNFLGVINFLTFDVEEWYESEFVQQTGYEPLAGSASQLERQKDIFLDICSQSGVRSTCFVTGKVARTQPWVVRDLLDKGHEIASHSCDHKLIYNKDTSSFRQDLRSSLGLLEDITGAKVKGYRAPSLSVNQEVSGWFYEILEEAGITYSSSVYPGKNFLYGYPEADPDIHIVPGRMVVEIPQRLWNLGFTKIGFAGGAYLRLLPAWLVNHLISRNNSNGKPVFIYAHPWELMRQKYPVKLSPLKALIQSWGIPWNASKLANIVSRHSASLVRMDDFAGQVLAAGDQLKESHK